MNNGVFNDISIIDYHNDKEYLSASGLKLAKKSLKLFKLYLDGIVDSTGKIQKEKASHFDFGNAFEIALLEPGSFDDYVSLYDVAQRPEQDKTMGSNKNKEWKEQIYNTDKYIINKEGEKESYQVVEEMLRSCYADSVIQKLIKNIEYQYSMFWTDRETGLKLKSRPDVCKSKKNVIVDVKTTTDGSPEKFSKDLANYDYPFQAVMQIDGVLQSGFMEKVDAYYWLVVEKEPPFSATLYEFDEEDRKYCADEYKYVLECVKRALEGNHFPSYSYRADNKYGILTAHLPLWYRNFGL